MYSHSSNNAHKPFIVKRIEKSDHRTEPVEIDERVEQKIRFI